MISYAAEGRFAAEFLVFLAAVGGLALVAVRPELLSARRGGRAALAVGFALLAGGAFVEGSLLVQDRSQPALVAARAAGIAAVALGGLRWAGGPRSTRVLWIGLVATAVATGLFAAGSGPTADAALGIGGFAVAVALRLASGRSLAARVAANSAAILLAVVLILAVSLSAVMGTTIRDDAGRRLDTRVAVEGYNASYQIPHDTVVVARNVGLEFDTNPDIQAATHALATGTDPNSGSMPPTLQSLFAKIQAYLAQDRALAYVNRAGHIYAQVLPQGFDPAVIAAAVGSQDVAEVFRDPTGQSTVASIGVAGRTAFVVGVQAVYDSASSSWPTAVVVVAPLNAGYLAERLVNVPDPNIRLAIVSRTGVLASIGGVGSPARLVPLADRTLDTGNGVSLSTGDRLLSASQPLNAGARPVAVMVASMPSTVVTNVRDKLLRTLFILAMAGTLLALALAAYAGERVSTGIRTLTQAARRIQRGNYAEPAAVRAEDEVGVLSDAFDSMALSISSQTRALQQAAEEETALRNQLEAVVAGMGDALVAVDASGRITLWNRAAEELIGLHADEVIGELVGDVLVAVGEDGTVLAPRLQRPTPTRWATTATVATELGPRIPVEITSGALRGPDTGVAGAVLVLRDLRPERAVERMKSEFLSRIGHELRTPLTGILGYAEILIRKPIPADRARDMHQQIIDAGRRLYRVVQMLEFSAASQAGRSLLRSEPMDVRTVVDDVVGAWSERLNGDHALARRVARHLPPVRGDRRWLAMAIDELIDNAVKFSPEGGRVAVRAHAVPWGDNGDARPAVQISVSDEGVGMSDAEQHDAFADFVQADGSDTRRFGGLGLGLSLVKRVAEAHGGGVEVESVPKRGSRFSIIIPAMPIEERR